MSGGLPKQSPAHSGRRVRVQLVYLVLTCVLPVWLVGGALVWYAYQSKRLTIERNLLETARTLRQRVDHELAAAQSAMKVLATSPALTTGDLATFDRQAREVVSAYPGADIIMADATGQQVINTRLPLGAQLPMRGTLETVRRIFSTGQPVVSDVFKGRVTNRYLIGIDVPVSRDGRVIYDLAITFPAARLEGLLGHDILAENWVRTIFDSTKTVVARSHNSQAFVGRPGPSVTEEVARVREGITELRNLEDIPVVVAFSRSTMFGWMVAVGVPKTTMLADLREWVWWTAGGSALLSIVGIGCALVMGRKIAEGSEALASSALALGRGEEVSVAPLHLKEANEVAAALVQASALLHQRSAERDQAEKGFREAKAEAEAANISKSKFLAAASHDLRQPLQALGLFLSVLAGRLGDDDKRLIANLEHCHGSLSEMLNDMLDISKLDAGVVVPKIDEFPLGELLEQVVASHKLPAHAKGLKLRVVGTNAMVRSDSALLQRVLTNLLSNAVRYTHHGGVLIGCRRHHGRRWIEVWDTGIGIPTEMVGEIFDEFRQLSSAERSRENGSGLGLAIVRKTAALLGLEIRVSSTPGKGSVFALELPMA